MRTMMERKASEVKKLSISPKRQITIPQKFYTQLGFSRGAECEIRGKELIIRPLQENGGEFAEEILSDLIKEGLSGEELLRAFRSRQKQIRPAVEEMLKEAKRVAEDTVPYYTIKTILEDPFVGEAKKGDLEGIFCLDIFYNKTNYEIAYAVYQEEDQIIIVIMAGTRENFYDSLKRYRK